MFLIRSGIIPEEKANDESGKKILQKFEFSKAWLEHKNQGKEDAMRKKRRPTRARKKFARCLNPDKNIEFYSRDFHSVSV